MGRFSLKFNIHRNKADKVDPKPPSSPAPTKESTPTLDTKVPVKLPTQTSTPSRTSTAGPDQSIPSVVGQDGGQLGSFWDAALENLRQDEEKKSLIDAYQMVLLQESGIEKGNLENDTLHGQMSALIDSKLRLIDEARWKFQVQGKTVVMRSAVDRIVKGVLFAQSFIAAAASADPHAGLAWAGVSLFLPASPPNRP
jgi:hypothetical protein